MGVHEHPTRYAPDKSELQVQGESVIKALEDAGLSKGDVDGLFTSSMSVRNSGLNLADYLDLNPRMVDNTSVGGASFEFHLSHALTAIAAGRMSCAVITYCTLARSGGIAVGTGGAARLGHPRLDPSPDSFEELYGVTTVGLYAMVAQRHMHQYGTTPEQLAEVSVAVRKHASMNPHAMFRNPITVEDVLRSRMISSPLHILDCCVITDGGGAVVVASPEVARGCRRPPVWVLGTGEGVAHQGAGKRDLAYMAARPDPAAGLRHGWGDPRRHRHVHDLRLVHHHRPHHPGGPGLLREGGGGRLRVRRQAPARRRAAHQHRRRRAVVQPPGNAGDLPADGGHQAATPRVRGDPAAGARLQDSPVPRHGGRPWAPGTAVARSSLGGTRR